MFLNSKNQAAALSKAMVSTTDRAREVSTMASPKESSCLKVTGTKQKVMDFLKI